MELTKEKIVELLETKDEKQIEALFAEARRVREQQFGNKIFLYGFVYF